MDLAVPRMRDGIALNFGFVLFIIFNTLQSYYKSQDGKPKNFLDDFKIALKESIRYIVLIFIFLLGYYHLIHPTFKEEQATRWKIEQINEMGGYESYLEEIIKSNNRNAATEEEKISREMYPKTEAGHVKEFKDDFKEQVSNWIFTSVMLLGLFFMACTLSAIGAATFKFFMRNVK
jgi:hypothetical protein